MDGLAQQLMDVFDKRLQTIIKAVNWQLAAMYQSIGAELQWPDVVLLPDAGTLLYNCK